MADSPLDLGRAIERSMGLTSAAIKAGVRASLDEAAKVAREEHAKTATLGPGPDRRYSQAGRAGKLGLRVRKFADAILVIPSGLWGIAERGARPHVMKAWGRGQARHPGTQAKQAKRAWSKAEAATLARLDREIPETVDRHVEEAF